jgi:FixJ family two-component response regulator
MNNEATVYIVDDDPDLQSALRAFLTNAGLRAEAFSTAEQFLSAYVPGSPGCLLVDLRLKVGMSGLELLNEIGNRRLDLPVVVLSGHLDVPSTVLLMRAGAMDVIEKPFDADNLLERLRAGLEQNLASRQERSNLGERMANLSAREREVMHLLVAAKGTKQIARDLGISPKTVEKHRANVLNKMQADNVVELIRLTLPRRRSPANELNGLASTNGRRFETNPKS